MLDDNSMMSIDEGYDPEKGIEIRFFEEISRMLDYKNVIFKFMVSNRQNTKVEVIEKFCKLLRKCNVTKGS